MGRHGQVRLEGAACLLLDAAASAMAAASSSSIGRAAIHGAVPPHKDIQAEACGSARIGHEGSGLQRLPCSRRSPCCCCLRPCCCPRRPRSGALCERVCAWEERRIQCALHKQVDCEGAAVQPLACGALVPRQGLRQRSQGRPQHSRRELCAPALCPPAIPAAIRTVTARTVTARTVTLLAAATTRRRHACILERCGDWSSVHDVVVANATERERGDGPKVASATDVSRAGCRCCCTSTTSSGSDVTSTAARPRQHMASGLRLALGDELLPARSGVNVRRGFVNAEADFVGEDSKIEEEMQREARVAGARPGRLWRKLQMHCERLVIEVKVGLDRVYMPCCAEVVGDSGDVDAPAVHRR